MNFCFFGTMNFPDNQFLPLRLEKQVMEVGTPQGQKTSMFS